MFTVTVCLLNLNPPSVANEIRLHGNRIMLQNHDSLVELRVSAKVSSQIARPSRVC